ncbi:MAG TPA: hypothetical protein VJU84_14795 [Pyrinomonadaceae bacterium]|nr:hypothetical protein [Pyrinomonadaceae bacterium]
MLAKHKVNKKFDSLEKLLNIATIGYYDVNADYAASDLATDIETTITLRVLLLTAETLLMPRATEFGYRTGRLLGATVIGTAMLPIRPALSCMSCFMLRGLISQVDSQEFTNAIQEHCRKQGYSNPIILTH